MGRTSVNSTARWPERLEHAATLLRAEGTAVISLQGGAWTTLFSYRIDSGLDWAGIVGPERLRAALASERPVMAAIPAGRWTEHAAYALVATIDPVPASASFLCAIRRNVPFDAIEIAGAHAAARLMATSIEDGRRLAVAERAGAARLAQRSVRHELERAHDPAALSRAAALIAASIDANGASIMLVDGADLRVRASVGLPQVMLGHSQRIGEGIAGYVAQTGEPVELSGAVRDPRFEGTDPDVGASLVIPLRSADRVIGVLNVKRSGTGAAFDDLERMLVNDLAEELAHAIAADAPAPIAAPEAAGPDPAPAPADVPGRRLRILAVEDHPVMRVGIKTLIEDAGMILAGLSATATEAVEQARQAGADVALVDLGLPDAEGVDVIERLHEAAPHLPTIAFTADSSSDRVRAAIRAGAIGYLTKGTPADRIVAALHAAASGLSALGPEEAAALAEHHDAVTVVQKAVERSLPVGFDAAPEPPQARPERAPDRIETDRATPDRPTKDALSARELELLKYLAEGYTNKEIARAMVLAEDTVKKAVQTLIAKLGATDRTHAVVLALRSDLIE